MAAEDHAEVPPNTPTTLRTTCAVKPCLLCWVRAKVAASPEAKAAKFSTEPLHLNIVGLRQENTVSDDFDDAMVVFMKMLPHDLKDPYEKHVEKEIRDDIAGIKSGRVKVVPCTASEFTGTWIVGVFDQVTTDPGLADRDKDTRQKAIDDAQKELDDKDKELTDHTPVAKKSQDDLAAKQLEQKDLRAKKEKTADDKQTIKDNDDALKKLTAQAKKDADKLQKLQNDRDRKATALAKKKAALAATDDSQVQMSQGHSGWLAQGRAQMAPGIYANEYRFGIHHGGADGLHHGHVAMTVGFIPGYRFYSVGNILAERAKAKKAHDEAEEKARKKAENAGKPAPEPTPIPGGVYAWAKDGIVLARHVPPGGAPKKFVGQEATMKLRLSADGKSYEAFLLEKGAETKLGDDDAVVVNAQIGGTNLHRAHNVEMKNHKQSGEEVKLGGKVSNWSEGCPTYRQYKNFN